MSFYSSVWQNGKQKVPLLPSKYNHCLRKSTHMTELWAISPTFYMEHHFYSKECLRDKSRLFIFERLAHVLLKTDKKKNRQKWACYFKENNSIGKPLRENHSFLVSIITFAGFWLVVFNFRQFLETIKSQCNWVVNLFQATLKTKMRKDLLQKFGCKFESFQK